MIAALMISAVFVFTAKGNVSVKKAKKGKKAIVKKGW
jgi:ABC-2 type transport system permease protein